MDFISAVMYMVGFNVIGNVQEIIFLQDPADRVRSPDIILSVWLHIVSVMLIDCEISLEWYMSKGDYLEKELKEEE